MKKHFVYELVDPRNGLIFYVGKGVGKRPYQHAKQAAKGINTAKCRLIREIEQASHQVAIVVLRYFASASAAFNFERKTIKSYGLENLTNIQPGGPAEWAKKADPETVALKEDRELLAALTNIANKTNGFEEMLSVRLGGQSFPVPAGFRDSMRSLLKGLVDRRGRDWCLSNSAQNSAVSA